MIAELHKGFKRYPDGREKCLPTSAGNAEYRRRREAMYARDNGICCVCSQFIRSVEEATFEHVRSKGLDGSRRDDRISVNGVSHYACNVRKGSRSLAAVRAELGLDTTSRLSAS